MNVRDFLVARVRTSQLECDAVSTVGDQVVESYLPNRLDDLDGLARWRRGGVRVSGGHALDPRGFVVQSGDGTLIYWLAIDDVLRAWYVGTWRSWEGLVVLLAEAVPGDEELAAAAATVLLGGHAGRLAP